MNRSLIFGKISLPQLIYKENKKMFKNYETVIFYTMSNIQKSNINYIENIMIGQLHQRSLNIPELVHQIIFGDVNRNGLLRVQNSILINYNDVSNLYYKKFKINLKDTSFDQRLAIQQTDPEFKKYIDDIPNTLNLILKGFNLYNYSIIQVQHEGDTYIIPNDILNCKFNIQNINNRDAVLDIKSINIDFLLDSLKSRDQNYIIQNIISDNLVVDWSKK